MTALPARISHGLMENSFGLGKLDNEGKGETLIREASASLAKKRREMCRLLARG